MDEFKHVDKKYLREIRKLRYPEHYRKRTMMLGIYRIIKVILIIFAILAVIGIYGFLSGQQGEFWKITAIVANIAIVLIMMRAAVRSKHHHIEKSWTLFQPPSSSMIPTKVLVE